MTGRGPYSAMRLSFCERSYVSPPEKGGALEGSEICRILSSGDSGSAVKNRDRQTRPLF